MCWNETVSLNTFIFSMGALLLIMYNNAYTKYKIEELNNNGEKMRRGILMGSTMSVKYINANWSHIL